MKATVIHNEKAIIIGGGIAGLAAASALGESGWSVEIHESRTRLGGRASSFQDKTSGEMIDNCQHVTMGCCTNFQHFCKTTGIEQFFREEPFLYFIGPDHKVNRFGSSGLPAPLHLASSFRKLSYFNFKQKVQIARCLKKLLALKESCPDKISFEKWLSQQNQSEYVIEHFWKVVLTSALSESMDRIAIPYARKVFLDGFVANKEGWSMSVPIVPLDRLYGETLLKWFNSHQIKVHTNSSIRHLEISNNQVSCAITSTGEKLYADEFIVAVPQSRISNLFDDKHTELLQLSTVNKLETAPISSIHLWFDRPIIQLPHAVITGKMIQWVFNREQLQTNPNEHLKTKSHYYQVVISASNELLKRSQEEIIYQALTELAEIWPEVDQAKVLHSRMISEHQAVISVTPESESFRISQKTSLENLNLAGDWTATGWPSTMEGATRSGYLAVKNILNHLTPPDEIVKSDLPVSWLSQRLFGL